MDDHISKMSKEELEKFFGIPDFLKRRATNKAKKVAKAQSTVVMPKSDHVKPAKSQLTEDKPQKKRRKRKKRRK